MSDPTIFMTSSEHLGEIAALRVCHPAGWVDSGRARALVLNVDPPFPTHGDNDGEAGRLLRTIHVMPHYRGDTLTVPLPFEPFAVYVMEPGNEGLGPVADRPVILAWCDLYETRERAEEVARLGVQDLE